MNSSTRLLGGGDTPELAKKRRIAYAASCICCLLSASFTVFSLYTKIFEIDLEYTPSQLNYVSIGAEMGLYLFVPLLGWIADAYKLSYLGYISAVTYVLGYGGCAWAARTHKSWPWMTLFFAIVGIACSAGFIASLVNCARLFPQSAILAISMPTTLYGCSSLIYAKVIDKLLISGTDISTLFLGLGSILFVVGCIVITAPRVGAVDTAVVTSLPTSNEPAISAKQYAARFFKEPTALWFLATFVLVSGPLEMYQNNIGIIVHSRNGNAAGEVAKQVAMFTGLSTATRLVVGTITDVFGVKPPILLLTLLTALVLTDFGYAMGVINSLSIVSALSGIGYGTSFTLYPLIVSHFFGIERFATYWGIFILGPAIGSFIFGVVFAFNMQDGGANVKVAFNICAFAVLISCIIILRLRLHHAY